MFPSIIVNFILSKQLGNWKYLEYTTFFLYDNFNGHPNNLETPTTTKLIISLNDAFKHLTKNISQTPISVLATFEKIFGMKSCKFGVQDNVSFILFRLTKTVNIDEKWIKQITDMFNVLLRYWENSILAAICSCHFLQNLNTQENDNPLTYEQKQQHLTRLRNILIRICQNLTNRQMADFNDNLGVLQNHLGNFEIFVNQSNVSLETKIEVKEKIETRLRIPSFISIGTTAAFWTSLNFQMKVFGTMTSDVLVFVMIIKQKKLREIIYEHECMQGTCKNFWARLMNRSNDIDFDDEIDGQLLIWLVQFEAFHDKITRVEFENRNVLSRLIAVETFVELKRNALYHDKQTERSAGKKIQIKTELDISLCPKKIQIKSGTLWAIQQVSLTSAFFHISNVGGCSLNAISGASSFLFDNSFSNGRPNNSVTPVATNLITILNNTFKYLARSAVEVPVLVLDRFNMQDGVSIILFRPAEADERWIRQTTDRFNAFLDNRRIWVQRQPMNSNLWSLAIAILAAIYNLGVLQNHLDNFETFVNQSNDDLKAKIEVLQKEKEMKEIKIGNNRSLGAMASGVFVGISFHYDIMIASGEINYELRIWLKKFRDFRDEIANMMVNFLGQNEERHMFDFCSDILNFADRDVPSYDQSLEFDLHGLILNQLAEVLSSDNNDTTNEELERLIKRCPEISMNNEEENQIGIINKICVQNISALASFASNTNNEAFVDEILPILLKYLKYLPNFSFEVDLTWKAIIVKELLNIAIKHKQQREKIFKEVISFMGTFSNLLKCGDGN
ncbi:9724_t:CDS:10 [Diversispora eburnea]|uniref:9724_t:CDS:1 n=1 Tax=Diversispora eburnea TaxID=1213867 RepID=A0A9N8YM92_9GLOM|nr:9724_t:CDS:10 [Diversispora eburnea]